MAYWRDRSQWNHTASIVAKIHNVNLGEGSDPITPDEISPYTAELESKSAPVRITRDNIGILKALAGRRQ